MRNPFKRRTHWQAKQELAAPGRYYGDGGTIHDTTYLDVETDSDGRVVSVWFRCQLLPFHQVEVDEQRAEAMRAGSAYLPALTGVEVVDR